MNMTIRMTKPWKAAIWAVSAVVVAGGAFLSGRTWAAGIPTTGALTYSGLLTDPDGTPLAGAHNVQVNFWRAATGGTTPLCQTPSEAVELEAGRFAVALPDNCVDAVKAGPNTWVEVLVDGASLGRTRVGAVPYAVEAGSAESASGSLQTTINALNAKTDLSALVTIATAFSDVRINAMNSTALTWTAVPGRTVTFMKRYATSRLKITYQDTLGTLGSMYAGCQWRIMLDAASVASFSDGDMGDPVAATGWRMSNAAHVAWATGGAGSHTVRVEWRGNRGAWGNTSECLSGWNQTGSFLSVEELP